ncbi:hypothetical protein GUITHDRAFT_152156 [Guillardia theta CCMP2712]|uniref:Uncharacterized protein n=1 Tax=Guillardia theta (strain CCMP2712) TaxID=905079 RepID=L1JG58_GUITC|nr:hypothetical protein GUITHDRAFT_152156 [Guillardia theta CCMP2712]EKX47085.1 hypothetical protein GUITHDRAFT_152156 [Guillardia theta CCMP2712]|eukprot:XP_005834065.1 hypothetical protein GUITHDRAFT_152156 [Guillardia theta CCMP2712]
MIEQSSQSSTLLLSSHLRPHLHCSSFGDSHGALVMQSPSACSAGRRRASLVVSTACARAHAASFCVRRNTIYSQVQDDFNDRQVSGSASGCVAFSIINLEITRRPCIDHNGNVLEDGAMKVLKMSEKSLGPSINQDGNFLGCGCKADCR